MSSGRQVSSSLQPTLPPMTRRPSRSEGWRDIPQRPTTVRAVPAPGGLVRLLDADPDLGIHLDRRAHALARWHLVVETIALRRGSWDPLRDPARGRDVLGSFVLDGALARRIVVGTRRSVELFGPGDV